MKVYLVPNFALNKKNIPTEFSRAHVLIVDDNSANRQVLRDVCEKIGVGIIDEAEDGVKALELIVRFHPDLILLDIQMPHMDGYELMQQLRTSPVYEHLTILVQTGLHDEDDRIKCFDLGATDVVSRPFHLGELQARIRVHLRSAISARVLFDFRTRIQAHIEITRDFLDAILPSRERSHQLAESFGILCSCIYQPHDEIGGDLWTLRQIDENRLALILIDASAHGLAGAINALRVDCLVQEYFEDVADPGVFINKLDMAMAKIAFGQLFAGAFALIYDRRNGLVQYAGSGMPNPLIASSSLVRELRTPGLPLGSGAVGSATESVTLQIGETLLLFSDGWSEQLNESPVDLVCRADRLAPDLAEQLTPKGNIADDLTIITLQRRS